MAERKALFLDMDGTTLNDAHQMPEANIRALERAARAGHEVIVTTGRPLASARLLYENYRLGEIGCRYMIAYNGGMVLDMKTGEVLYQKTLPLEHLRTLMAGARDQGLYLQTYVGDFVLSEREDENLAHYTSKTGMKAKVVPDLTEFLSEEPCKALAIDVHSPEPLKKFMDRMADWASDKVDMYLSSREYLEIVPKGISKGNALRDFCARIGIPVEHSVAAGDETNDIDMLKAAGVGCAVKNAQPEVKAAADYVTERDNNQAAVEEIVERFLLRG